MENINKQIQNLENNKLLCESLLSRLPKERTLMISSKLISTKIKLEKAQRNLENNI